MRYLAVWACAILLLEEIWGYEMFQEFIPNGEIVPHPCKANYIWHGVGHKNMFGGGERNPFGLAFYAAGKEWSLTLCQQDSDGDGKTNGEELGDPNCVWIPGQSPSRSSGLSHPGVCEPMNSLNCAGKNDWVDCQVEEFECDAINNNVSTVTRITSGPSLISYSPSSIALTVVAGIVTSSLPEIKTRNLTVRFPVTDVPPKETTYTCMIFDLPQDGDYHLVATKVITDNVNVMHHIIVYGCEEAENSQIPLNQPYDCAMSPSGGCSDIIGVWTVGMSGECHHESSGFRIGVNGYKRAAFQFHWNNPALINGTTDSSGMTLYYTSKLRPHDAGVLVIGQIYLHIPPGETAVTAIGTCPGECTSKYMTDKINIITALNHMHYLGIHQRIELLRNGSEVQDITNDEKYSYDSPVIYRYDNPIEVRPGDELKTTCVFKSTSRYKTTIFGEDTSNEMCIGLLTYYPKDNFANPVCTQWNSVSMCDWEKDVIQGCRHQDFYNLSSNETLAIYFSVMENCVPLGKCQKECLGTVKEIKKHPCFQGDMEKLLRLRALSKEDSSFKSLLLMFYAALDSCNIDLACH